MGRPAYHTPDTPASPAEPTPRQRAMQLMSRKDELEKELRSQQAILTANNSNMTTPLVDSEGFPRADIDVYVVRHARVRIIELRNDLNSLTDQIGKALEEVHRAATPPMETDDAGPPSTALPLPDRTLAPFARVDGVAPGSPASEAGLKRDDLLLQFGTLTAESFADNGLHPLSALVSSHENRQLVIRVRRTVDSGESLDMDVKFTPRKWGGRGLLGCHILPV